MMYMRYCGKSAWNGSKIDSSLQNSKFFENASADFAQNLTKQNKTKQKQKQIMK